MPDLPEEQVKEAIRSLEAIEKVIDTLLSESEQLSVENIRRELLDIRWSASRLPKKAGKHYYDKKIEKLINSTMDVDSALQHLRYELEETMQAAGNDAMRFKTGDVEAYRNVSEVCSLVRSN